MSTSAQNPDIPVPEMMKQFTEVTKIISRDRIQQCTLEQISDTSVSQAVKELDEPCKVLARDKPQRQFDVIVGINQDVTDKARNTGSEKSGNQTMIEMMSIGDCDSSMERECDVSILIKQICAKSDVMSQCVLSLCYDRSVAAQDGTLHETDRDIAGCCWWVLRESGHGLGEDVRFCSSVPSLLNEGMSDGGHCGPQNSEIVGILKQLMDETRVDLQTLEKMESEHFKAEGAPFVKLKGLITRLINRLETEMSHVSHCNEETSMTAEKEDLGADVMSSSTVFTLPEVIYEAELKNVETNRTAMQDTLVGKYQLDGINTLEEMNVNDQMITDKQSPDIAGEIHINKDDLDNSAGDQIIMSEYANDEIGGAVPLIQLMT